MDLTALIPLIITSAPFWLTALKGTVLDKSREIVLEKSKEIAQEKGKTLIQRTFHLDEEEQILHLEQALKNATEQGLVNFTTQGERDKYKDIIYTRMQLGPHSEEFRGEALHLFSLSDTPVRDTD